MTPEAAAISLPSALSQHLLSCLILIRHALSDREALSSHTQPPDPAFLQSISDSVLALLHQQGHWIVDMEQMAVVECLRVVLVLMEGWMQGGEARGEGGKKMVSIDKALVV